MMEPVPPAPENAPLVRYGFAAVFIAACLYNLALATMKRAAKRDAPKQVADFKKMARELECDESEKAFDKTLRKLAKAKPNARPSE